MPVTRFQQIRERLWADITANALGDKLPPEPELAKRYDVSRMTLRRAIAGLVAEGFLTAQQGRGTFVVRDRISPSTANRTIGLVIDQHESAPGNALFTVSRVIDCLRMSINTKRKIT